ncbi:signal peptidase II [Prauserella alba]|uniref:Lipoprotein signal peptidase n=1 Tax=Prauserella alba TaxID=176898 RepID=A0ABP4G7R0_9PSEU|nr:signal peptidase II [Prauserella alba]
MNTERESETATSGERAGDGGRPARYVVLLASVAVVAYLIDLVTKVAATAALEGEEPVRILGGIVYLQLIRNPYAAFGMDFGGTWILALVALAVVGVIIWFAGKLRSTGWAIGLGLVLAGALGNLTDRVFRAPAPLQGHVVDFLSVFGPDGRYFPVFNAADSAITVGAVLIVVLSVLGRDYDGTITRGPKKNTGDTGETDDEAAETASGTDTDAPSETAPEPETAPEAAPETAASGSADDGRRSSTTARKDAEDEA